jgi:hypothetical protein
VEEMSRDEQADGMPVEGRRRPEADGTDRETAESAAFAPEAVRVSVPAASDQVADVAKLPLLTERVRDESPPREKLARVSETVSPFAMSNAGWKSTAIATGATV